MPSGSVAVQASEGLGDVLDGRRREMVGGGEGEQCLAERAQDGRIRLALLDLVLDGVEDRREGAEAIIREAAGEPPFQRFDPLDGLLVVLHGDLDHAPLLDRWVLP